MWKEGQSGNPAGRPPRSERYKTFEQACREAVVALLPGMVEAVQDEAVPVKERASVFGMLAEHGFGKAVDRIQVANMAVGQGSLKDADMDVLMGTLERRTSALIGSDMGQDIDEPLDIQSDHLEHNGLENRQEDDHDQ